MKGSFYGAQMQMSEADGLRNFVAGCRTLEALIHGPDRYEDMDLPNEWRGIRFGRPELQHLCIQAFFACRSCPPRQNEGNPR